LIGLSFPKIPSGLGGASCGRIIARLEPMLAVLHSLGMFIVDFFKPRWRREAENLCMANS
jgi:hypothetical protein